MHGSWEGWYLWGSRQLNVHGYLVVDDHYGNHIMLLRYVRTCIHVGEYASVLIFSRCVYIQLLCSHASQPLLAQKAMNGLVKCLWGSCLQEICLNVTLRSFSNVSARDLHCKLQLTTISSPSDIYCCFFRLSYSATFKWVLVYYTPLSA